MNKYIAVYKANFMDNLAYPARILSGTLGNSAALLVYILLWIAVFKEKESIGDYTLKSMILYYMVTYLVRNLTVSGSSARLLQKSVREGTLSIFLQKPIIFNLYFLVKSLSDKFASFVLPAIILLLVTIKWNPEFYKLSTVLIFTISLILGVLINHLIYTLLGMISFWTININGARSIFGRVTDILSGSVFPLDLLGKTLINISKYLPFKFMHFSIVSIYLGKVSFDQALENILIQVTWITILAILYKFIYQKGIKQYESVGI
ncbi:hypothetical protein COV24_04370 [candidate division WWE3 bacterium CG10_big_fil_rev_8_21_14_0_10_32_10]|uniref:ABC transporter permease n=1 Tax=candidate division WWE3 bacterium CG10_big_fil_rev_8_21_14_0_10_32_10 TaxID=1975090 RepID=A0A2H0R9C0_UNCKA|nr:MAG: hypothetical protein COV24_04370 [candidate division WWE3 bacterium CG10_big_fil_rev_8_21_14_0_10_32_10]